MHLEIAGVEMLQLIMGPRLIIYSENSDNIVLHTQYKLEALSPF